VLANIWLEAIISLAAPGNFTDSLLLHALSTK
jgi:hypothetical protein